MPELPEVETVRRQLARVLVGARIERLTTGANNYFFVTSPRALKIALVGRSFVDLERHGKYLICHLDDESRLLLHLGMTGQFTSHAVAHDPHVHMVMHLSDGHCVTLRDVRKFGKVEWIAQGGQSARLNKLGIDALLTTTDQLLAKFSSRNIAIKTALLDQSIWAGVGNIYADEALFRARIHPQRAASALNRRQVDSLRKRTQDLLQQAILAGGSTINDYLKPDGELGGFQDFHQVYAKEGLPCPQCSQPIQRIVLAGRSTHYCKHCQK